MAFALVYLHEKEVWDVINSLSIILRGGFSVRQIGQLPKVKLNTLSDLLSFPSSPPPHPLPPHTRIALLMAYMHNCV